MRTQSDTETLHGFIGSLQFKLGHVAGNAQQLLDLLVDQDMEQKTKVRRLILEIKDAVFYVNKALRDVAE